VVVPSSIAAGIVVRAPEYPASADGRVRLVERARFWPSPTRSDTVIVATAFVATPAIVPSIVNRPKPASLPVGIAFQSIGSRRLVPSE
jgi:hypothetical protein